MDLQSEIADFDGIIQEAAEDRRRRKICWKISGHNNDIDEADIDFWLLLVSTEENVVHGLNSLSAYALHNNTQGIKGKLAFDYMGRLAKRGRRVWVGFNTILRLVPLARVAKVVFRSCKI